MIMRATGGGLLRSPVIISIDEMSGTCWKFERGRLSIFIHFHSTPVLSQLNACRDRMNHHQNILPVFKEFLGQRKRGELECGMIKA